LVILLLVIYGTTSIGATVHMHFCMNEFVSWNLWHSAKEKKCSKCGMKEKKGGCCKDEHKQLKIDSDQNKNQLKTFVFEKVFTPVIPTSHYDYNFRLPTPTILEFPKNNTSPPWRSVSIYIANCVFLI
jgi:hypothetical protein